MLGKNTNIERTLKEVINTINLPKLCYELYKLDWKHSHGITKDMEMDSIKDYYEGLVDSDSDYTYGDYIEEFGYNGEVYSSFSEFCDTEYLDEEYMRELLDNENLKSIN